MIIYASCLAILSMYALLAVQGIDNAGMQSGGNNGGIYALNFPYVSCLPVCEQTKTLATSDDTGKQKLIAKDRNVSSLEV